MGRLILLIVVLLSIGIVLTVVKALLRGTAGGRAAVRAGSPPPSPPPDPAPAVHLYVRQGRIMTQNEAAFYRVLRAELGEQYLILAQLPLSRVISPDERDRSRYTTALNRIDRKTVDFALVDPESMAVSAVIELNDSSHNRRDRQERDNLVRDALRQADIRFIEIPAAGSYSAASLAPLLALLTNARG